MREARWGHPPGLLMRRHSPASATGQGLSRSIAPNSSSSGRCPGRQTKSPVSAREAQRKPGRKRHSNECRDLPMADTTESQGQPPSKDELKRAMKAFKKRLKLTRLDEESKIGRNPLTTGKGSGIVAITPPNDFPQAVWDELVKQGRLKYAGHGTYELAEG